MRHTVALLPAARCPLPCAANRSRTRARRPVAVPSARNKHWQTHSSSPRGPAQRVSKASNCLHRYFMHSGPKASPSCTIANSFGAPPRPCISGRLPPCRSTSTPTPPTTPMTSSKYLAPLYLCRIWPPPQRHLPPQPLLPHLCTQCTTPSRHCPAHLGPE